MIGIPEDIKKTLMKNVKAQPELLDASIPLEIIIPL
jgi:hypothetical protein